ncbi:ABC transporter substrate-binding protein [Corynebacterium suedekumii]|nr:ABC transporter substrate-binding protein [Corynebacterium suedekumii]
MFSDGEPVTAADVVFTYDLLKEDGTQFDLTNVAEVRAVDERTVEIELVQPDSLFGLQAATIAILPEHAYGEGYSQNPIASGPYRVVEYQDGEQLIMEANPHYPEELTYRKLTFYLADEEAALSAAQAGTVDVAKVSYTNADRQFEGMTLEQLESVETMAITLPTEPAGGTAETMGIEGPGGNDVTSDRAVRKALSLGVDRRELNDIVVAGYGEPAYSVADTLPWGTEDVRFADADPEGAKKLLADAGWIDTNGDGTVDKDGVEAVVGLMYTTSDPARADLAESSRRTGRRARHPFRAGGGDLGRHLRRGQVQGRRFRARLAEPEGAVGHLLLRVRRRELQQHAQLLRPGGGRAPDQGRLADTLGESIPEWQAAQAAGASSHPETGDVSMLWILRRDHLYFINDRVDIGEQITHGHGHGMQIFQNVTQWR